MASQIEEIIEDLEEYIDSCKPSAFSSSKIVINRDEIEAIISELRTKVPNELSRSRKIIMNQEAILADAERKAREIIDAAQIHTSELVSEHQIMQQAYAQANEVVNIATKNAQDLLDNATRDANEIRQSAITYTDDLLKGIQEIIEKSVAITRSNQDNYINTMNGYLNTVMENRMQLTPNPIVDELMNSKPGRNRASSNVKAEPAPEAPLVTINTGALPEVPENAVLTNEAETPQADAQSEVPLSIQNTGVLDIPEGFFKK